MSGTITADSTPKDLIPGDVEQLETLRATLRAYAGAFADAKLRLRTVDESEWQGAAAMDFRSAVRHIPDTLDTAHESFDRAAKAVADYADVLAEAQHKVRPIIEDAADARRASRTHQQDVDEYNVAVDRDADPLPTRPPETDPGAAAMADCQAQVDKLREQVEEAAHRAKKHLDSAAESAPDEPGWFSKLLGGREEPPQGRLRRPRRRWAAHQHPGSPLPLGHDAGQRRRRHAVWGPASRRVRQVRRRLGHPQERTCPLGGTHPARCRCRPGHWWRQCRRHSRRSGR
ncbi:putative T7SS-secreted protein [Streptomyces sp. SDT5-1]|uniref:putative T7SS-secreted protein n=1 Tax=Streptomyces sp. SDT5-1 TaxID=3406418 RepID=UPI003FCFCA67